MCRVRVTGGPECLCEKREHAKRVIDLTNSSDELLSVFDSFHYIPHNHPSHNLGFHSNRNISAADLSHKDNDLCHRDPRGHRKLVFPQRNPTRNKNNLSGPL